MPDSGGGDTAELRVARATPGDAAAIQSVRIDAWRTAYRDVLPAAFLASLDAQQGIQALSDHLNRQSEKYFALVCRFSQAGTPEDPPVPQLPWLTLYRRR